MLSDDSDFEGFLRPESFCADSTLALYRTLVLYQPSLRESFFVTIIQLRANRKLPRTMSAKKIETFLKNTAFMTEFIPHVQSFPCLWDKDFEESRSRFSRQQAWVQISDKIGPEKRKYNKS